VFENALQSQRHASTQPPLPLSPIIRALLLLPLFWVTVSIALADLLWTRTPQWAVFFDPTFAKARQANALSKLTDEYADPQGPEVELKEILKRDPIAPGLVTSLAKFYFARQHAEKASKLWPIAASLTWRDGDAQSEALKIALNAQQYARAVDHFDAMMRVYYGQSQKVLAGIVSNLEEPAFRSVLIARLAENPPWRATFLSTLGQIKISIGSVNEIYETLIRTASPLASNELRPYLQRLVANKFYENAYVIWLASLPKSMKPTSDLLYNGEFQFPLSNMPFDWSVDPVAGVDIDIERNGFTRSLKVMFSHTRSRFQNMRQILLLAPGGYEFSGREAADTLSNERGVRWRIHCVTEPDGALAVSPPLIDTVPWRDFRVGFSVPLSCPVQEIVLEIPSRALAERNASGSVAYSGLSIQPMLTKTVR